MNCYTFTYQYTNYVRTPTCGGMDSEFSHTEIATRTLRIVTPGETEAWLDMAKKYVENYAGNNHDKNFKIISITFQSIHAIFSVRTTT